jgi:Family of unknown function (DUF6325)
LANGRDPRNPHDAIVTDLVAYLMFVMPDVGAVRSVVPALVSLVEQATIRIVDVVVLTRDDGGSVATLELEAVEHLAPLRDLDVEVGGMLSGHDIEMLSLALDYGTATFVLVAEDRWATALCEAVRAAGGNIIAGERIDARRVRAALSEEMQDSEGA